MKHLLDNTSGFSTTVIQEITSNLASDTQSLFKFGYLNQINSINLIPRTDVDQ